MTINTAVGPKTPEEALKLFTAAKLNVGALLGIFTQLTEHAPNEAKTASKHALEFPERYNEKIVRLAKEQSTGRPANSKRQITTLEATLALLKGAGDAPTMTITFRKNSTKLLSELSYFVIRGYITFNDSDAMMFLTNCVLPSGEWEQIPRTYIVTVRASGGKLEMLADVFTRTLETIELQSNLDDRAAGMADSAIAAVVARRKDNVVFYDASIFQMVCDLSGFAEKSADLMRKIEDPNAPIEEVMKAVPPTSRLQFFETYIKWFDREMAAS